MTQHGDTNQHTKNSLVPLERAPLVADGPDAVGRTALMRAVVKNSTNDVRHLLALPGVDLEARDFAGRTALLLAVANQAYDIAEFLIRATA